MGGEVYAAVVVLGVLLNAASYYALAFRLGHLKRSRKSLRAPSTADFLMGNFGWRGAGFIFGTEHEAINDRTVSRLVFAVRTLWVGVIVLILGGGFLSLI